MVRASRVGSARADFTDDVTEERVAPVGWENLIRRGTSARRVDRENQFYPLYLEPSSGRIVGIGETHCCRGLGLRSPCPVLRELKSFGRSVRTVPKAAGAYPHLQRDNCSLGGLYERVGRIEPPVNGR